MDAIIFIALAGLFPGQEAAPLQVRDAVVDRGEVKAGAPLAQAFDLCNRSRAPLIITEVAGACGCLRPRLARKEIAPGASAELIVEVNTLSQPAGPIVWRTTVRFAQGTARGELELRIKAVMVREVFIEPVALGLTIDKEASHTFTLTDRRARPLTITAARCSSSAIRAELAAAGVNDRGERVQRVTITILDTFPPGRSTETLQIITDDEQYRELRVPITVNRRAPGEVRATPGQIELRLAKGQTAASGLVRLRDPDDRPVVIERLEAGHPALRTKWAAGPGSMVTLRLGVATDGKPTTGRCDVKVHIKEPKPQVLVIPVTWQAP